MTKKEWLNRAWRLELEIRALEQEKERAFGRACSTTGQTTDDRVQTSKSNGSESKFTSYADYSMFLDQKIDQLYNIKKEVLDAIAKVDNPVYRALLYRRHINFETWEKIAVEMHYSYYYIKKELYKNALRKIKIPTPPHAIM